MPLKTSQGGFFLHAAAFLPSSSLLRCSTALFGLFFCVFLSIAILSFPYCHNSWVLDALPRADRRGGRAFVPSESSYPDLSG